MASYDGATSLKENDQLDSRGAGPYYRSFPGGTFDEGLAVPDTTPPTVVNLEPVAGTPMLPDTPITFDVLDAVGFVLLVPMISFDDFGAPEPTTDHLGNFMPLYQRGGSTRTTITDGWRYVLRRKGGWTTNPRLIIWAVDTSGNIYTI